MHFAGWLSWPGNVVSRTAFDASVLCVRSVVQEFSVLVGWAEPAKPNEMEPLAFSVVWPNDAAQLGFSFVQPNLQVLASGPRRTAETAFHMSVFSVLSVAKIVSASALHISVLSVLSVAKIQRIQAYK